MNIQKRASALIEKMAIGEGTPGEGDAIKRAREGVARAKPTGRGTPGLIGNTDGSKLRNDKGEDATGGLNTNAASKGLGFKARGQKDRAEFNSAADASFKGFRGR